ncbi:hypothetical protein IFR05_006181 [Cadophora sp. M221]|nr:hypothetical protein IFR05_006181 [Cadophora sp. M221]
MTSPEEFTLLPLACFDAAEILRLHYQVYIFDPLHSRSTPQSESAFITSKLASKMADLNKPHIHASILVPSSNTSRIASYILYHISYLIIQARLIVVVKKIERDLSGDVESLRNGLDKDLVFRLKMEDRVVK